MPVPPTTLTLPFPGPLSVKHPQTETLRCLSAELAELNTKEAAAKLSKSDNEAQIAAIQAKKEKTREKREKVLEVFSALGTTATAAGLSVINPLAIPVAFGGLVGLINMCFSKKGKNDTAGQVEALASGAAEAVVNDVATT